MTNTNTIILRYVERMEALESSRKALAEDMKELKEEMKNDQIDVKALSAIVKLRSSAKAVKSLRTVAIYAAAVQLDLFNE